jgi:hypothetical protein
MYKKCIYIIFGESIFKSHLQPAFLTTLNCSFFCPSEQEIAAT